MLYKGPLLRRETLKDIVREWKYLAEDIIQVFLQSLVSQRVPIAVQFQVVEIIIP